MKHIIYDESGEINLEGLNEVSLCEDLVELAGFESQEVEFVIVIGEVLKETQAKIAEFSKNKSISLFVHNSQVERWTSFSDDEFVITGFDEVLEIKGLVNDDALKAHGVDLTVVKNIDKLNDDLIQGAIDKVYEKVEEQSMSDDNNDKTDTGLNISIPDVSLDLSDGDDEPTETQAAPVDDSNDLDLGDTTSSDLSFDEEKKEEFDAAPPADDSNDLDLGDDTSTDLSFDEDKKEEFDAAPPADDSNDLDLGESTSSDLSFDEEKKEEFDAAPPADDSNDLDLGDSTSSDLSFDEEKKEEFDAAPPADDSNDLDLGDSTDSLSMSAEGDTPIENADIDMDSNDLDLDAMVESAEQDVNTDEATETVTATAPISDELDDDFADDLDDDLDDLDDGDKTVKTAITAQASDLDDDFADDLDDDFDDMDDMDDLGDMDDLDENTSATVPMKTPPPAPAEFTVNVKTQDQETKTIGTETFNTSMQNMADNTATQNYEMPSQEPMAQPEIDRSNLMSSLTSNELLDLRVTISELKDDRKNLITQISELEDERNSLKQANLGLKADMDELKIEISILKKRHMAEIEEYRHQADIAKERSSILEAKNKSYKTEMDRLGHKIRVDFNKIKQREKELENQLELMSIDADSKVKSRDNKILELKRKIDSLEFNMENVSIKERQSKKDKVELEDKLNKVVSTLRSSLKHLEEEMDIESLKSELDI